ncbi:MAG TPA: class I SAM-dependent methyltransferase [Dehalococcoidia bacterium]|nr:class I SAM-dependent methyltransferase [Dehalococcoidia bacterium]
MLELVPEAIEAYAAAHTTPLDPLMQELADATLREMGDRSTMLSGHVEGVFLQTIVAATGARRVLEIGMFTGFSALMMAAALPEDGRLVTCDIDPKAVEFATAYFRRSEHGRKIEVRLGPALETLKTLSGPFDVVFIDADKRNYLNYYEAALGLLAPGGTIVVDNTLWSGEVLDPKEDDARAISEFNARVRNDERVRAVLLTVRDGVTLIRRR